MVNIKLKWNKVTFDDVEIDVNAGVDGMKELIYSLTDVPKDRQKLMAKGAWIGTLKDDADLSKLKLTEGHTVMLMGSAEVVEKPSVPIAFLEDMTVAEQIQTGAVKPSGLANLGNTCYMNATVECLRYMPELRQAFGPVRNQSLTTALRDTFLGLDSTGVSMPPFQFVQQLRQNYPQFAEMTPTRSGFVQQDAEEFYNTLMSVISNDVNSTNNDFRSLLGIQLEHTTKCQQVEAEPVIISHEDVNKLVCNIQGGSGALLNVNHLSEGVKLNFEGVVEKHSDILGTNTLWDKKTRISSLPRYICFQFMRFFWKATPESRDHQGVKCKILRAVTFPETMDVYEFCNDNLQQKLRANRVRADKKFEAEMARKRAKVAEEASSSSSSSSTAMDVDSSTTSTAATTATAATAAATVEEPMVRLGNGLPDDFTGQYELCGVVTHKGRSADSGHYIGWVRQLPGSDSWWCFDDDKVSEVRTDEIMKLAGGGDREMAYLNFYRYKHTGDEEGK